MYNAKLKTYLLLHDASLNDCIGFMQHALHTTVIISLNKRCSVILKYLKINNYPYQVLSEGHSTPFTHGVSISR